MTESSALTVGDEAPDFSATLVRPDGDTSETTLSNLLADRPVLLAFYTNDFSPDCISEWCSFRDYDWFATGEQVQVVGVSKSRPYTHRKFIDYLGLGFPLFTDAGLAISDAYGVKYRAFKLFPRPRRSCFLIDQDQEIRYRWVGEHAIDATRDKPPVSEVHQAITDELGEPETETFGFS